MLGLLIYTYLFNFNLVHILPSFSVFQAYSFVLIIFTGLARRAELSVANGPDFPTLVLKTYS